MKTILFIVLSSVCLASGLNNTDYRNKTKRNLSSEVQNYGDPNTVWFYPDSLKSSLRTPENNNFAPLPKPLALVGLQPAVKVFEPKVAAQQIVFDYQNPSSNVNQKHIFQPENNGAVGNEYKPAPLNVSPNPGNLPSETIVNPVQHSHVIQHHPPAQPIVNPRIHPLYNVQSYNIPQQPQQQQQQPPYGLHQQSIYNVPKKFVYINGKLIYDPSALHLQQTPATNYYNPAQQFHQQLYPRQPLTNYNHPLKPNLTPPPVINNNKFSPPAKHQMQTVDTPSQAPFAKERDNKRKQEKPVREKEESEDDDERGSYHDEDSEDDSPFDKLQFDDEDSDHLDFKDDEDEESERIEDEEDDDNNRGSTRHVVSKVKKYPKKKYSPHKERYYYSGQYEYPNEKPSKKDGKNKHKMHYKSVKYTRDSRDPVEGRYSENVPVFHKKKVFKEKWYVSKSHNKNDTF